jgi:hypothetical protein
MLCCFQITPTIHPFNNIQFSIWHGAMCTQFLGHSITLTIPLYNTPLQYPLRYPIISTILSTLMISIPKALKKTRQYWISDRIMKICWDSSISLYKAMSCLLVVEIIKLTWLHAFELRCSLVKNSRVVKNSSNSNSLIYNW